MLNAQNLRKQSDRENDSVFNYFKKNQLNSTLRNHNPYPNQHFIDKLHFYPRNFLLFISFLLKFGFQNSKTKRKEKKRKEHKQTHISEFLRKRMGQDVEKHDRSTKRCKMKYRTSGHGIPNSVSSITTIYPCQRKDVILLRSIILRERRRQNNGKDNQQAINEKLK